MPTVSVIGSGFAGLSAACFLARAGNKVTVFEKNETVGGRARDFSANGFMFDMGPSWYWMPETFEQFFGAFGKKPSDYYNLVRLDPGFQMFFGKDDILTVPADMDGVKAEFERIEKGSAAQLDKFLADAKFKYDVGMNRMVYTPCFSWLEFAKPDIVASAMRLQMFTSVRSQVRSYFKDPRIIALMEFPVLFLGATASNIPALYSMMNYAAISLGTWYPMGGMTEIIKGMHSLAGSLGVEFKTGDAVRQLSVAGNVVDSLHSVTGKYTQDGVIATGDYHHIERNLLPEAYTNYSEDYWDKRTFAPSSLIFYLGVSKKIKKLIHHNLFFDESLDEHAEEIYKQPKWPTKPLFYVCCPSKTDPSVAPEGMENIFILMPLAPGLEDTEALREKYYNVIMKRMEVICDDTIKEHVIYKRSYCINDFVSDYNAYKGNAYGLANTLRQTAVLKPSLRNKKVKNLFYAGQLTVPGPGVPPSLISGRLAAEQLMKTFK